MAQPKLDIVSLAVSRRIGDQVSTSSTDGEVITAAQRLAAINRARGTLFTQLITQLGLRQFADTFPSFVLYEANVTVSPTKDSRIHKAIKVVYNNIIAEEIPAEQIADAIGNQYSAWYTPTGGTLRFYEANNEIVVLGAGVGVTTATVLFIQKPIDIAGYGGANADLIEPYEWLDMITDEAVRTILSGLQIT